MTQSLLPPVTGRDSGNRHAESSSVHEQIPHHGPSHEEIAHRAYDIFAAKGHHHGECKKNWQQAERELRQDKQSIDAKQEMQNEGGTSSPAAGLFGKEALSVHDTSPK